MTDSWNHTITKEGGFWRMDVVSNVCDSVCRDTGEQHILTFPSLSLHNYEFSIISLLPTSRALILKKQRSQLPTHLCCCKGCNYSSGLNSVIFIDIKFGPQLALTQPCCTCQCFAAFQPFSQTSNFQILPGKQPACNAGRGE